MKKLPLEKLKAQKQEKASQGTLELKIPHLVESNKDVREAVDHLSEIIENQEQYDFDQIKGILIELSSKLDLAPLFTSLEEAFKTTTKKDTSHLDLVKTQREGFSKLQKAFSEIKPQVTVKAVDTIMEYRAADAEVGDTNSYYGFLHPTGKWYILRQSGELNASFRYATGSKDYGTAWNKRTNQDYKLYSEVRL